MPLKILDEYHTGSIPYRFRRKRFDFFLSLLSTIQRPVHILDVGGTEEYWNTMGFDEKDVYVTLYNLSISPVNRMNFSSVSGDGTDLKQYRDNEFDLVFSNSVIEHVFTWNNQVKMADEIRRVGKRYYVQTPNYYFPIEPHWMFPLFQFLPKKIKVKLTQHFTLGHREKAGTEAKALQSVEEVKLLTGKQVMRLFPNGVMHKEVFLGFVKSFVVYYFPVNERNA